VFRRQGAARTGLPLMETTIMYGPDGKEMFSSTKEVIELSRAPLDAALFDVPAGYTEAGNMQELYGMPDAGSMTMPSEAQQTVGQMDGGVNNSVSGMETKKPGMLRVGVATINNKAGKPVSIDSLRVRLIGGLEGSGLDAVPLNALSQLEAEAECKAKQCDFILLTDISGLKSSAAKKIGGMFGRAAGVEGIDKTEAKVDFRLFAVGESSPRLQSSATAKQEGDEESAGMAIDTEAKQVAAAVRKRS
jgi:hypothetical protein